MLQAVVGEWIIQVELDYTYFMAAKDSAYNFINLDSVVYIYFTTAHHFLREIASLSPFNRVKNGGAV